MSRVRILVSGGGIAGSVVAHWLGKVGLQVTVIERASELRLSGQGVDIRGRGVDIIERMGIGEQIKQMTTKEVGTLFVDDQDQTLATLDADGGKNLTAEIEIIRGDLQKIMYDSALSTGNVEYKFGLSITSLAQTDDYVTVDFSNGRSDNYDLVVAADGLGSKVRRLILGPDVSKSSYYPLNTYVAYFSLPRQPQDGPRSRWYTTTRRRAILIRPRDETRSSAYLNIITDSGSDSEARIRSAQASGDLAQQKEVVASLFRDAAWTETDRVLDGLEKAGSDDFYFQDIAQVRLPTESWHKGRCVLVGDAAYCPTPFTGMGTTLAIVGAYVLAGEIVSVVESQAQSRGSADRIVLSTASCQISFNNYTDRIGNYVKSVQKIPLGGYLIYLVNPASSIGLWILRTVLWFVDRTGLLGLLNSIAGGQPKEESDDLAIPEYQFLSN